MKQYIEEICQKIEILNPVHSKKLKKNIASFDHRYFEVANSFFEKYLLTLAEENKTLDYALDCYLNMISDMNIEMVEFVRTGKYSSSTFKEVNNRVYARPETMEYYMQGLIMSQFLWRHHYLMYDYFVSSLPVYREITRNYLEIGAGHGLFLSKALEIMDDRTNFTVVDISQTSIEMAKKFSTNNRVSYHIKDIFDFGSDIRYDFITMGEVLEHVEDPLGLLVKLKDLLVENGTVFITTPTNAPAIDHIYLFNSIAEIQELIKAAGFKIRLEKSFLSEDVSAEKAAKFKITILYGAFLEKDKGELL